jgi:hypothetical protein
MLYSLSAEWVFVNLLVASVRVGMFLYCGDVEFDGGVVVVENEEERKAVR